MRKVVVFTADKITSLMRKFTITLLSFLLFTAGFTSAQVADELGAPFVVSNVQVWQEDGSFIAQHLIVLGKENIKFIDSESSLEDWAHLPQIEGNGYLYPGMVNASFSQNRGTPATNTFASAQSDPTQGPITRMELGDQQAYVAHARIADHSDWKNDGQQQWRELGFSSAYLTPDKGILQGKAAHIALDGRDLAHAIIEASGLEFASLRSGTGGYPGTPMSALAVLRQIFLLQNSNESYPAINIGDTIVVRANSSREIENFLDLQRDYDTQQRTWVIYGGRDAHLHSDRLLKQRVAVLYQINFDEAPATEEDLELDNEDREYWRQPLAQRNEQRRLHQKQVNGFIELRNSGVWCGLLPTNDSDDFTERCQQLIDAGLTADELRLAMSSDVLDIIQSYSTLSDYMLCAEPFGDSMQSPTWMFSNGMAFRLSDDDKKDSDDDFDNTMFDGGWHLTSETQMGTREFGITVSSSDNSVHSFQLEDRSQTLDCSDVKFSNGKLSFIFYVEEMDLNITTTVSIKDDKLSGKLNTSFGDIDVRGERLSDEVEVETKDDDEDDEASDEELAVGHPQYPTDSDDFRRPHSDWAANGATTLFFRGATLYRMDGSSPAISNLLTVKGKIVGIGNDVVAPNDATIIDASGWHIMPGIIDAHSHLALDSINEGKVAISAECRIGDMIRPQDVGIWRAAAGGTTVVQSLHGSANPIGGQAATWELNYWEPSINDLLIEDAAQNIKFALGENVKQSNWASAWGKRFPNTRVGVDAVYRRAFMAAQDYRLQRELAEQGRWPDFVEDVRLEVLADILDNKIHIQCHSYRADELLMFLKVCADFGIERPTFQHVLEGYKVANEIAAAGAMASTFSDWWAYKYEVKDAIPWNVEILHKAGVIVSINSDSDEMIRRLNTEAAKAMLYGGLSYEDAMATCTTNSAKQLRLADRLGSIEVGKYASLSVFDKHPLSNYARCVLTLSQGNVLYEQPQSMDSRWVEYAQQSREFAKQHASLVEMDDNLMQIDAELMSKFTKLGDGKSYYIQNANIHAVSEKAFSGSLLIENGIIKEIYRGRSTPPMRANLEIVDANGKDLYPGFINSLDRTGLVEIESLRASDDTVEIGDDQADLTVEVAIHADSAHHNITRMTGVSYVLTQPGRGRIRGQGAFIQLAGTTTADMIIKRHGLFINFPRSARFEQKDGPTENDNVEELNNWIELTKEYASIEMHAQRDSKLEALMPYFIDKQQIFLVADSAATIMAARDWVAKHDLNVVYVSAKKSYQVAGYLGADNASIITGPVHSLPTGSAESAFDYPYRSPSLLTAAGCRVALYTNDINVTRNLPFQAATAAAWSVDSSFDALRSITLGAAEVLQLDPYIGSIEVGKVASFFICDGDPFENGVPVERLFIGGSEVDIVSHQSQLRNRYLKRLR